MTAKSTWLWIIVAASLFAFIYFFEGRLHTPIPGPAKVLPGFDPAVVDRVQVQPANQLEVRAERTNDSWVLTEPLRYPAQKAGIERFLQALQGLTAAAYITPSELRNRPRADEEYGFASPQDTIVIEPGDLHIHVGLLTVPGDQVFLQVVGKDGVYVVDADFLKSVPRAPNDWRDPTLIDLNALAFDRMAVTNTSAGFGLQRDAITRLWRILPPIEERADSGKIEAALQSLAMLRIEKFVSDEPGKSDLESFGLQPAVLALALSQGTNLAAVLEFGKSPTNDARVVYARRQGQNAIFLVPGDPLSAWRDKADAFRDPHLIEFTESVSAIEVRGEETFSLQRQGSNAWRVLPQDFPADAGLVQEFLSNLSQFPAALVKGVVIDPDLAGYGLGPPRRRYLLESAGTNTEAGATNRLIAELDFGTNVDDKVYAHRTDESAVYSISLPDFQRLPAASWRLRDRRVWSFSTNDIAGITIRQRGKVRNIVRKGPYHWSLAAGSQGIINDLAIEDGVREFGRLTANTWVARGERDRARCGFTADSQSLTVELKSGAKLAIEFGGPASANAAYAAVAFEGETWIFEFPGWLYQYVGYCLSIPADIP